MVNTLSRRQARTIAGAAISGLRWLAPQIAQEIKNQVTDYIERRGQAALNDIQQFIQHQINGIADYALGDGVTQSRMQRDIKQAARSIYNSLQNTETEPTARQQLINENRHNALANEYGERQNMDYEDYQSMVQREVEVSNEIMQGMFIYQFASWKTQLILTKNNKQIQLQQSQHG